MGAEIEDNILSRTRNIAMDVQATMHMTQSYLSGEKEWLCICHACNYVRKSPQVMDAIARAIVKNYPKTEKALKEIME